MSPDTKTEVGRIAAAICDGLCHWPRVLGEAALSEKCDDCRPIIDIANLAEKLEDSGERERERKSCQGSSALRGADYGA